MDILMLAHCRAHKKLDGKFQILYWVQFEVDPSGWLFENSIHIACMDTQINSILICSKTQHRKDSLRLTLKKFKLFKLINTLEIIFVAFHCWQHSWAEASSLEKNFNLIRVKVAATQLGDAKHIAIGHQRDYADDPWANRLLIRGVYDSLPNCHNGYLQQMSCCRNLSPERSAGGSQARAPGISCKWCVYQR